jgi:Ca2+-binding RTX toxin-like protein
MMGADKLSPNSEDRTMASASGTGAVKPSGGVAYFGSAKIDGPMTEGDDTLYGTDDGDQIDGLGGNDVIIGFDGDDRLYGGEGDDWLYGGGDNDRLWGGWGNDHLDGGAGVDMVSYMDRYYSGYSVNVNLATGFATVRDGNTPGWEEVDTLVSIENAYGTWGDDVFYGDAGSNELNGYFGNDYITGGGGADYIDGWSGRDQAIYRDSPVGVTVNLATGTGFGGTAEGDQLIRIEDLAGSEHDDHLTGDEGVNLLFGRNGHDVLKGAGGDDRLSGDAGGDTLKGGGGADVLHGGEGYDTAAYTGSSASVRVALFDGTAAGGDAAGDTLTSIEHLTGSDHDDGLSGNNGFNILDGATGNDTLKGYGGSDRLTGGDGNDVIVGGSGPDELYGGDDADSFIWFYISDTGVIGASADTIQDFNFGQGDGIDLSSIDADVYAAGNQTFTFIGQAGFSGTPGEINYIYSGGDTLIQLQTGMDADVEGVIRLAGIHTPQASWFVL